LQPAQGQGGQELSKGADDQETGGVLTPGQGKIQQDFGDARAFTNKKGAAVPL